MLNILADALLLASRMHADPRRHDRNEDRRPTAQDQLPSERHVFPKLGL